MTSTAVPFLPSVTRRPIRLVAAFALAAAALAPREVIIPAEIDRPEAAILARLALGRGVPPPGSPPPSPLYLRAPDARLPAA